jgi:tetratricopeptide (TPR) repeat protein
MLKGFCSPLSKPRDGARWEGRAAKVCLRDARGPAYNPGGARADDNSNWISADDITTNTRGIHARHVLIVSDSCYSGTIVRDADVTLSAPTEHDRYLAKMIEGKSRTLMASGGNEPVADGGGSGHSVFAKALLGGITQMDGERFTAGELFRDHIVESVAGTANLARDLVKLGKLPEAETEARTAVRMTPDDARFHNLLGIVLRAQNKLAEAVAEFTEAARLAPSNVEYQIDMKQTAARLKPKP